LSKRRQPQYVLQPTCRRNKCCLSLLWLLGFGASLALLIWLRRIAAALTFQASGMANRITVSSFDWSSLNLTQTLAPELPLAALPSGDT
jgi:hypothetical protein